MNTETYDIVAANQNSAAIHELFSVIRQKWDRIRNIAEVQIKEGTIEAANLSREVGLAIQTAMDREQMKFETFEMFFRDNSNELPPGFSADSARKFLSAVRRFPEPITSFKDALQVMDQMTFFAVGLLDVPVRTIPQTAVSRTAIESLAGIWSKLDESLNKMREQLPTDKWDRTIWLTVRDATEESAKLHSEALEKLKAK